MGSILSNDLFNHVLIDPIKRGSRELFVLSGYASATMVSRQFEYALKVLKCEISIDLHVGMSGKDGLSRSNLLGMQAIPRQRLGQRFNCTFNVKGTSNHSKLYVWCSDSGPVEAFLGSSNFTQFGFGLLQSSAKHSEVCVAVDPNEAFNYVVDASQGSIGYQSSDIYEYIDIYDDLKPEGMSQDHEELKSGNQESVVLPLIQLKGSESGQTHQKSGLNWGHREGREPNQAYIPVPSNVAQSNFFPSRGIHFQMTTDDGQAFICTIAQDGDKALETPFDNSILGKYFRQRLGLEPGSFVSTEDLTRYGANAIRISKINAEFYHLDFKPGIVIPQVNTFR